MVKSLCLDLRVYNPVVVLCSRSAENGNSAARGLKLDPSPVVRKLDITSESSVASLAQWLQKNHGGIDILINNAAVAHPQKRGIEQADLCVEVNYFGTRRVCESLLPLLRPGGRVINVSSSVGQINPAVAEASGCPMAVST